MPSDENINGVENNDMHQYTKLAADVVTFRIVYDECDLDTSARKSNSFHPDMTHQVFGETEMIFGYRQLSINLYYLYKSAKCFVDIQAAGKVTECETYKADDINTALEPWLPENYYTDRVPFLKELKQESKSKDFGETIAKFTGSGERKKNYVVKFCDNTDKEFQEFHKRFQTFIVWFIDGANFIDLDDERWVVYYVYEESTNETTKEVQLSPVAFCTVYKFFLYPASIRSRISQFFVLPTHQRRGIATEFYSAVFKHLKSIAEIKDITVEEPTPIFQQIRDLCDSTLIYNYIQEHKIDLTQKHDKQIKEIFASQKLCRRQTQRVLDLLECFRAQLKSAQDYSKIVDEIKKRFINSYEKENRVGKRFCNAQHKPIETDPMDKKAAIDGTVGKYIESLEWPLARIKKTLA